MLARRRLIVLLLGLAAFGACLILGDGSRAARAGGVVALMALWWIGEALPIHWTACVPLLAFPLLSVFPGGLRENLAGTARAYTDPYLFLFLGGMAIAAAMQQWGLHRRVALTILARVGGAPERLLLGVLLATAFVSLWISNTATATMMVPIGIALVKQLELREGRCPRRYAASLMLAVAYGSNVGGIGTKLGTPTNAALAGFLAARGIDLGFFEFALIGTGFVLLFLPITWLVLWRAGRADAPAAGAGAAAVRAELQTLGPLSAGERRVLAVFGAAALLWIGASPLTSALRPLLAPFELRTAHVEAGVAVLAALALVVQRSGGRAVLEGRSLLLVPWSALLLLGGSFALAAGVAHSGLADQGARGLEVLRAQPLLLQALAASFATVALSAVASNTATIGVMLPVLWSAVPEARATTVLFAATIASSCDFALPAGTPPNAIVFGSGYVTIPRMVRIGLVLDLLAALLAALWCLAVVPRVL